MTTDSTTQTGTTDLAVLNLPKHELALLLVNGGLEEVYQHIKKESKPEEVPDLETKRGRDHVKSVAFSISRSKTAVEKVCRDYVREIKAAVSPAEQEIRRFIALCDELRDQKRLPLTEYEEKIKQEEAAAAAAAEAIKVKAEIDRDHEFGLLMDNQFNIERAEAKRKQEEEDRVAEEARQEALREEARLAVQQEHEKALQRQKQEFEAALQRERQAEQAKAEAAERARKQEEAERLAKIAVEEKARKEKLAAEEKARQEEERARLAREADIEHRRNINRNVLEQLLKVVDITEDQGIAIVKHIANNSITDLYIKY